MFSRATRRAFGRFQFWLGQAQNTGPNDPSTGLSSPTCQVRVSTCSSSTSFPQLQAPDLSGRCPQPQAPDLSGHCRASTAGSRSQWALQAPDLSGHCRASRIERQIECQNRCRKECQNRCQVDFQKNCLVERQRKCQNRGQEGCRIGCQNDAR